MFNRVSAAFTLLSLVPLPMALFAQTPVSEAFQAPPPSVVFPSPIPPSAPIVHAAPDMGNESTPCGSRCCGPTFTVELNWLFLQRGALNDATIFRSAGGSDLLNADAFDFDWQSGVEASFAYRLSDPAYSITGRYMWLNASSDSTSLTVDGADALATNPLNTRGFTTLDNVTCRSEFQSAEIGLRNQAFDWLSLSAGIRYVRFKDELIDAQIGVGAFPGVAIGANEFSAANNLYGLQVGADAILWRQDRWQLDGTVMGGIYLNDVDSSATAIFPPLGTNTRLADSAQNAAFLGEAGLEASYRITERMRLAVGYRFIYMAGIATAANQIASTTDIENLTVPQRTTIDSNGSAFLHGVTVGLQWDF